MLCFLYNKFIFDKKYKNLPTAHYVILQILHSLILGTIDIAIIGLTILLIIDAIN